MVINILTCSYTTIILKLLEEFCYNLSEAHLSKMEKSCSTSFPFYRNYISSQIIKNPNSSIHTCKLWSSEKNGPTISLGTIMSDPHRFTAFPTSTTYWWRSCPQLSFPQKPFLLMWCIFLPSWDLSIQAFYQPTGLFTYFVYCSFTLVSCSSLCKFFTYWQLAYAARIYLPMRSTISHSISICLTVSVHFLQKSGTAQFYANVHYSSSLALS